MIVPYRNEASSIGACCEALQGQSIGRDRYEVLFVDNRSTDGTSELIGCAPGVTVIREERPGPYAARNAAIRSARADLPTEILYQHDSSGLLFTWAKRRFTTECTELTEMPGRLVSVNSVTSVVSPFPVTLTSSPAGG